MTLWRIIMCLHVFNSVLFDLAVTCEKYSVLKRRKILFYDVSMGAEQYDMTVHFVNFYGLVVVYDLRSLLFGLTDFNWME